MPVAALLLLLPQVAPLPGVYLPAEGSQDAAILHRFDSLPAEEQARISHEALQAVRDMDHPWAARNRAFLADSRVLALKRLPREEAPLWDAERFAPALKLKHKALSPRDARWKALEAQCFGKERPLPQSNRWAWDDGQRVLRMPQAPPPREIILALLNGRCDPLGEAAAAVEALLDDGKHQASASYFDHVYRDRKGNSYPGITLGDIWGSQTTFGISDADAIAWMHTVADDHSLSSPIPGDQQRPLYRRIEEDFVVLRDVRSLRRALALRTTECLAEIPAPLHATVPLLDQAWAQQQQEVERMAAFLSKHPQRVAFFAAVRQLATVRKESAHAAPDPIAEARQAFPQLVRDRTLEFLADEGLLGFRRR